MADPVLLSAVLIVFGLVRWMHVLESPEFRNLGDCEVSWRPLVEVLRGETRSVVAGSIASIAALVYLLSYGTQQLGIPNSTLLWITVLSAVVWMGVIAGSAVLADRLGRRRMFLGGAVLAVVWAFPFFQLVDTRFSRSCCWVPRWRPSRRWRAHRRHCWPGCSRSGCVTAAPRWPTSSGSVLGVAIAPIAATALFAATGTSLSVAAYMAAMALLSLVGGLMLRRSADRDPAEAAGVGSAATDARATRAGRRSG